MTMNPPISRRSAILGGAAAVGVAAGLSTATAPPAAAADGPAGPKPLQMAYFRTWHDKATDPTRPNSMADIPAEIDVAFVFPDFTPPESAFWTTLRDSYVPTLHSRGTKVVRTTDITTLLNTNYPNTAQGHKDLAANIYNTLIKPFGLDGLDVDVERSLTTAQVDQAAGVFAELGALIHATPGSMLIYDTNQDGNTALFGRCASVADYVLVQSYGRAVSGLQNTWNTYSSRISADKYLIGFSFYEENGTNWGDVNPPFETSRAAQYADWQPTGTTKAGIFSYAVDRDGVAPGSNTIVKTSYSWSKQLKARMTA